VADPLGTGFKSLSQSESFTFPEHLKPCVYGAKTPKQEGKCYSLDTALKRKPQVKIKIL